VLSSMTTREVNGVSIVALDGRLVFGEESNALRAEVKGLIAEGKQKIVLNMENVEYIDSAGLGMLVAANLSAKTMVHRCASATSAVNSRRCCRSPDLRRFSRCAVKA
jgi:anti-anti-sigma factor